MYSEQEEGIRSYRNCHILSYLHQGENVCVGTYLVTLNLLHFMAASTRSIRGEENKPVSLVIMQPSIKSAGAQFVYHLWR